MSESSLSAYRKPSVGFDPVGIAKSLRPLLEKHAGECERERRVPEVVMQALRESGLLRMMFPKRAGGPGALLITHMETIAEIAKGCVGTAWSFGLLSGVTGTIAGLPSETTKRVFKTGDELCCSASSLTADAKQTSGGYIVTGTWGYASGCLHAAWALNGIKVLDGTGAVVDVGFALIPLTDPQVTIKDTWRVMGVAGSGSNTIVAQEVFIPECMTLLRSRTPSAEQLLAMEGLEPRDHWPMEPLFPLGVLAPMLGAASAIQESVVANMTKRSIVGWTYPSQRDAHAYVAQLGEAAMQIDSAWLHIRRAVQYLDATAQERPLTGFDKAQIQADSGYAMGMLRSAADKLMEIAGPSGFADTNPLQRLWRDLNFGSRHSALNTRLSLELYGRALIGLESNLLLLPDVSK